MRVLFLTLYPESMPSSRHRIYQHIPFLRDMGIESTIIPPLPDPLFSWFYRSRSKVLRFSQYFAEYLGTFWRAFVSRCYEVVLIQKGILLTNAWGMERLFDGRKQRLVFDLDDAVYGTNIVDFGSRILRGMQDPDQTRKLSARCRAVIAGNQFLKELALPYNPNVYVVPTPVDSDRFAPRNNHRAGTKQKLVIGWLGRAPGLIYFRSILKALSAIAAQYPVEIRIVTDWSGVSFSIPGVEVNQVSWFLETEVEELNRFDIGISPLLDDEWGRGKCSMKLLQYMAIGLPTVSSRAGMNREVVDDGVDGFLADSQEEWIDKLSRLIENPGLRLKMGEAARVKILEKYALRKVSARFGKALLEIGSAR